MYLLQLQATDVHAALGRLLDLARVAGLKLAAVSAQAAAIHDMFVSTLGTSAGSYAATEAANAVAAS